MVRQTGSVTLNLVQTRVWRDGECVGKDFPLADVSEQVKDCLLYTSDAADE